MYCNMRVGLGRYDYETGDEGKRRKMIAQWNEEKGGPTFLWQVRDIEVRRRLT